MRYGKKIRDGLKNIKRLTTRKYKCPLCTRISVRRISTGIWQCKKCGTKFASNAYKFEVKKHV